MNAAQGDGLSADQTLDLTEAEERSYRSESGLGTDAAGNLVLSGLSSEESRWFIDYKRRSLAYRQTKRDRPVPEDRRRYLALFEKYEYTRAQIIAAENERAVDGPTIN